MRDNELGARRKWLITINNLTEQDLGLRCDGTDDKDAYDRAASTLVDRWMRGANGRPRDPDRNGAASVIERGKGGHHHAHMVIVSMSAVEAGTIRHRFPGCHLDPIDGTVAQALDYLDKRHSERHSDKAETQLSDRQMAGRPLEVGRDRPAVRGASVYDQIDGLLDEGLTPDDICAIGTRYAHHAKAIDRHYDSRLSSQASRRRQVTCFYHFGGPGSGKSSVFDTLGDEERRAYYIAEYTHPYDSYMGEQIIYFDDFEGRNVEPCSLFALLEGRLRRLPARYRDRPVVCDEVHIASLLEPERLVGSGELYERLMARLDTVVYHYVFSNSDGEREYGAVSVPAGDYVDSHTMRAQAMAAILNGREGEQ